MKYFCISHISSKTFAFHIFLCNFDTFFFHYLLFKLDWGKLKAERFTAPSTKAYISLTLILEKNDFESEAERFLKGPPLSDFLSLGEARNGTAAFTQNIYSYFYQLDRDRSWETSKEVLFDRNCILLYSLFYHILCKKLYGGCFVLGFSSLSPTTARLTFSSTMCYATSLKSTCAQMCHLFALGTHISKGIFDSLTHCPSH